MAKTTGKDPRGSAVPVRWGPPTGGPKTGRVEALHIPGTGQRKPMKAGQRGRVLISSKNKRRGRQESMGVES